MKIMIIKPSPWDSQTFYKSQHPEYVAIRNIVLKNTGNDFTLVGYGLHYEHFQLGKIKFYNLGSGNKFKFLLSFTLNFWLPLLFRSSVIVGMGGYNLIPMQLASMLTRAKFIAVIIGEIRGFKGMVPRPVTGLFKALARASFNSSDAILAISKNVKTELLEDFKVLPQRVFLYKYKISNIFNTHVPKSLKNSLNPFGPIVLTVCRIAAQKGLQYLIEASTDVIKTIPNVKFVIRAYGSEPEYRQNICNLITERNLNSHFIIIEEFTPYDEIPKYMAASDVFVLPSLWEGLGMVILEAMACGLPVIATNVGGIPDIVINNENGILVQPMDPQALANAIIHVLLDERERQNLSNGALNTTQREVENEFQNTLSKLIFL